MEPEGRYQRQGGRGRVSVTTVEETSAPPRVRLRWWREVAYTLAFYFVYSFVRNLQGTVEKARENAEAIIRLERAIGMYHEHSVQRWFGIHPTADLAHLHWHTFIQFWNVFYGSAHFGVTIFAIVWLFKVHPERYPLWRNTLAFTTALALIGFTFFPLMPPRLVGEGFVDTLKEIGGLWSFESGPVHSVSNQYAAMPSLHFAWSVWCALVFLPHLKRGWSRALAISYPCATLFAIVVTGNHYIIDAVAGAAVLALAYVLARPYTDLLDRRGGIRGLLGLREAPAARTPAS